MATPEQPGSTVGETATAGDYTWSWNGYGWDLVAGAAGNWFADIQISAQMVAHVHTPQFLDYV